MNDDFTITEEEKIEISEAIKDYMKTIPGAGDDTREWDSSSMAAAIIPLINKISAETIKAALEEIEVNSELIDWEDEENGIKREFQEDWWQSFKAKLLKI